MKQLLGAFMIAGAIVVVLSVAFFVGCVYLSGRPNLFFGYETRDLAKYTAPTGQDPQTAHFPATLPDYPKDRLSYRHWAGFGAAGATVTLYVQHEASMFDVTVRSLPEPVRASPSSDSERDYVRRLAADHGVNWQWGEGEIWFYTDAQSLTTTGVWMRESTGELFYFAHFD
ncbi:MAG: hypothetical protein AAGD00_01995 [Planctomycetota bacterium]